MSTSAKEPTTKQLIERWENVLRVLRSLTPHQRKKHWDMRTWGMETECGTVACAAGHCALDPWFQKRGFQGSMVQGSDCRVLAFNGDTFTRDCEVIQFFGSHGTSRIFLNQNRRPVSAVIREVRSHIKWLKEQL